MMAMTIGLLGLALIANVAVSVVRHLGATKAVERCERIGDLQDEQHRALVAGDGSRFAAVTEEISKLAAAS